MSYRNDSSCPLVSLNPDAIEKWLSNWCVTNSVTTNAQFNTAVNALTDAQACAAFRTFMKKLADVL
jgi:hypothetical protein